MYFIPNLLSPIQICLCGKNRLQFFTTFAFQEKILEDRLFMNYWTDAELRYINDLYEDLVKLCKQRKTKPENLEKIDKAFQFANQAHAGVRRKSGEPYIAHPLAVATIVVGEIGLGTTAALAAILHDVVEDTDYTLEDIKNIFGEKVAGIVDGLTKLSGTFDSAQAANFRKMLMTLSDDVRVILIKLADRLHNMRTLDSMFLHKQMKIAGETLYIFAPLAHRLGLYAIKTELEDLSLKYQHPEAYERISLQLRDQESRRNYLVNQFIDPINQRLKKEGFDFNIAARSKSIFSIWNKMQAKKISFDEIYDLLAIRIVFNPKKNISEKRQCFDILSLVTDIYKPKPDRIRDWITMPKANGYEALHVTVMGPEGKWVEVQIRTKRMDEIAEKGFAAHYKYKGIKSNESELDKWLGKIREMLQNPESDALDFLDEFKLNLFAQEIVVFTPKGLMKTLPKDATVLDFAYDIHTDLGTKCIGAKVNHRLVPLSHKLSSGDQVEIITSEKQNPQVEWLDFVVTARAKNKIRDAFKKQQKAHIEKGRQFLTDELNRLKITKPSANTFRKLIEHYHLHSKDQLYAQIGLGIVKLDNLNKILLKRTENKFIKYWKLSFLKPGKPTKQDNKKIDKRQPIVLEDDNAQYILASCCSPIPGDKVLGFLNDDNQIHIHKKNCQEALKLMANQGDRIVTANWIISKKLSHLIHLHINGFDRIAVVNDITNVISNELTINMRSIKFESHDGIFEGDLFLYVYNTEDLDNLITKLKKIKSVDTVVRTDKIE